MPTDRSSRSPALGSRSVLLTGAGGYIGRFVSVALAQFGYRPINFDDFSRGRPRSPALVGPIEEGPLIREAIEAVVARHRPIAVLHFAGARPRIGRPSSGVDQDPNFIGTQSVLEGLMKADTRVVVLASSAAVYGPGHRLATEDTPLHPTRTYGKAKLAAEQLVRRWGDASPSRRWTILRLANAAGADARRMLGWFESDRTLIPAAIATAAGTQPCVRILGTSFPTHDGTAVRDFVHCCDIARATAHSLQHLLGHGHNEIFNVASGQGHSVAQVLAATSQITTRTIRTQQYPAVPLEIPELVLSPARLATVTGFMPSQSNIDAIIRSAWDWHQATFSVDPRGAPGGPDQMTRPEATKDDGG